MTVWIFVIAITAIACASLYYAASRGTVNATAGNDAVKASFRARLAEIDSAVTSGRLGAAEAESARGELAREVIAEKKGNAPVPVARNRAATTIALGAIAVLSLGLYWALGKPDQPNAPLATRDVAAQNSIDLESAVKTIEKRLTDQPDDLRGWKVIAPAYMQLGRYDDAARAFARINALAGPTADGETDLAEAMMARDNGQVGPDVMNLLRSAASRDEKHIRSRFYIAGEETRAGQYEAAVRDWTDLLALGTGDEPWAATARDGLKFAQAALTPAAPDAIDQAQIAGMVDGLDARLKSEGGTIAEWTQLVRSRLVQGRTEDAQAAYDAARKAYPDALMRIDLDVLAADNGLVARPAQ